MVHVQSLLGAFMGISLRPASLIDKALFMVGSKNLNFGTNPQVPDYQDFGIIGCLMKVILLYLVIWPCQKQNSALYNNKKPICSALNQYEGQKI